MLKTCQSQLSIVLLEFYTNCKRSALDEREEYVGKTDIRW